MEETLEIYLNSKSSNKQNSTADCFFHIPHIDINKNEKVYVAVRNATIPYSWFNINSNNNKIVINTLLFSEIFYLDEGNYNVNTLADEIFAKTGLSATYLKSKNKFSFSFSGSFTIEETSNCFELLGLSNKTHISTNDIIESDLGVNLFTVRQIYVTSNNFILNNINSSTHSNANILCSVQVTGNPNSIIHYENTSSKHLIHHLDNITNLHISLIDQDGNILELNGINWSMTLQIYIIKEKKEIKK